MKKYIIIAFILIIILIFLFGDTIIGFITLTSSDNCQDSDLGRDYNTQGTVSGGYHSPLSLKAFNPSEDYFSESDFCEDEKTLIEHYCKGKEINQRKAQEKVRCSEACTEGRCIGEANPKTSINFFKSFIIILVIIIVFWFLINTKKPKSKKGRIKRQNYK